jgi:hypothetical protein
MLQDEHGINIGLVEVSAVDDIVQAVNSYEADKKRIKELEEVLGKVVECVPKPENVEWIYDEQCEEYYYMAKELEQLLKEVRNNV